MHFPHSPGTKNPASQHIISASDPERANTQRNAFRREKQAIRCVIMGIHTTHTPSSSRRTALPKGATRKGGTICGKGFIRVSGRTRSEGGYFSFVPSPVS